VCLIMLILILLCEYRQRSLHSSNRIISKSLWLESSYGDEIFSNSIERIIKWMYEELSKLSVRKVLCKWCQAVSTRINPTRLIHYVKMTWCSAHSLATKILTLSVFKSMKSIEDIIETSLLKIQLKSFGFLSNKDN
jgi:hypothetical protein